MERRKCPSYEYAAGRGYGAIKRKTISVLNREFSIRKRFNIEIYMKRAGVFAPAHFFAVIRRVLPDCRVLPDIRFSGLEMRR